MKERKFWGETSQGSPPLYLMKLVFWSSWSNHLIILKILIKFVFWSNWSFDQFFLLIKLVIWSIWSFDQIGPLLKIWRFNLIKILWFFCFRLSWTCLTNVIMIYLVSLIKWSLDHVDHFKHIDHFDQLHNLFMNHIGCLT